MMLGIFCTWMVPVKTCRRDRQTAEVTLRRSNLETFSSLDQLMLVVFELAVLLEKWKETVAIVERSVTDNWPLVIGK